MKYYELTYLASPELSENEAKELQQKINSSVQNKGGILDFSSDIFRTSLKYPIKNITEAYLVTLIFNLSPEETPKLEKEIKNEGKIIRFLLFAKAKAKEPEIEIEKTPREKPAGKEPVEPDVSVKKTEKEKKVELKDIEKKLEEILE